MTLISENNRQYYAGTQTFIADGVNFDFTTTFNTDLVFATADPTNVNWPTNNFYLEVSIDGGLTYTPLYNTYTVSGNTITVTAGLAVGNYLKVQLTENTVWNNYGGYSYTSLADVITNYMIAYVGAGKLIPSVKEQMLYFMLNAVYKSLAMIH